MVNYQPTSAAGIKGWAKIRRYLATHKSISYGRAVRFSTSQVVNRLVSQKVLAITTL